MTPFFFTATKKPKWHKFRWKISNLLVRLARYIKPDNKEVIAFYMGVYMDQLITGQAIVRVNPYEYQDDKSKRK